MILRLELYSSFGYLFYLNRYALTRNFSRNKTLKRDIESAYKVNESCPSCKSTNFQMHGTGTEQVEEVLRTNFKKVPIKIQLNLRTNR